MTEELATIVRELRAAIVVPAERRLWSMAEIADYSGYSVSTVQQRIVCLTDFPDAITVDQAAQPRWPAGEVMEWFESKRRSRLSLGKPRAKRQP